MASKVGDVVFQAGESIDLEAFWDDSALIKAYEKAVNSFKYGSNADSVDNTTDKKKNRRKRKKNKKQTKDPCDEYDDSSSTNWHLGDLCQAVFSEDGLIYNAEIIEIFDHNNTCVVRYMDYGNEEEQYLTDLMSFTDKQHAENHIITEQNAAGSAPIQNGDDSKAIKSSHQGLEWHISDLCIAPELPHQHLHEAVINSFPSQYTCKVTFIKSRKSQDVNIQDLKSSENYHNHATTDSYHPTNVMFNPPFPPFLHPGPFMGSFPHPFQSPPYPSNPTPPFGNGWTPPSNTRKQFTSSEGIPRPPVPPPPPPMSIGDPGGGDESLASMLMSWYLSGYHTGYFKAVQQFRNSNDSVKSNTKSEATCQPTTSQPSPAQRDMDTKE